MFCCLAGHRKTSCVSTQHELHLRFYQWTIISRHLAAASAAEKEGEEVLYGIPITPIWIFLYVFIIIVSRSEFFAITLKRWARGHLDHRSLQSMSRVLFSYNLYSRPWTIQFKFLLHMTRRIKFFFCILCCRFQEIGEAAYGNIESTFSY